MTMPLSGTIYHLEAGTCYDQSAHQIFKCLSSPITKISKAMQNVENGVLWGLGSPKIIGNVTIWLRIYDFIFNFNRNYACISYHFRAIVSHLSKIADFNIPNLHLVPCWTWPYSNFAKIFGIRKHSLRNPKFSHFEKIPACDRHTDTQWQQIPQ